MAKKDETKIADGIDLHEGTRMELLQIQSKINELSNMQSSIMTNYLRGRGIKAVDKYAPEPDFSRLIKVK